MCIDAQNHGIYFEHHCCGPWIWFSSWIQTLCRLWMDCCCVWILTIREHHELTEIYLNKQQTETLIYWKFTSPLKIIYVHSNQQHNSNLHFEHTSTWWVSKPFTLQKRHISRRTFNFIHPKQVYSHLLFCSIVCLTKYHSYTSPDLVVYSNIFQLIHDVLVW